MSLSAKGSRLLTGIAALGIILIVLPGCFGGGGGGTTYAVSGRITHASNPQQGIPDVTLTFSGGFGTATTDLSGNWTKSGLRGTVTVTPAKDGWAFQPPSRQVSSAATDVNFTGTVVNRQLLVPAQYPTIQAAIDAAQDGDLVIVSQGTYVENLDFKGKAITVRSTDPSDPAVVASTVIDGGQNGPVVTFHSGETADAALTGFTITNGWIGIIISKAAPTIMANVIRDNKEHGIWVQGGWPVIAGNVIEENGVIGGRSGGGIYAAEGGPVIRDNIIRGNKADYGGGAYLHNNAPDLVFTRNTVQENVGIFAGGGVWVAGTSFETSHNTIERNSTGGCGGGISWLSGNMTIRNSTIRGNTASGDGGGIYAVGPPTLVATSNTIEGNTAAGNGGGIFAHSSTLVATSNTIEGNTAVGDGGGICLGNSGWLSSSVINDNLIAQNGARNGGGLYLVQWARARVFANRFNANTAAGCGGAIRVSADSRIQDDQGRPLPDPDTYNTYSGNSPDDVYYE